MRCAQTEDNLVGKALAACGRRAAVRLVKRIPLGAGLGGGSADAAAILRWAGATDPVLAARLGADVPFCVVGGRARVGGVGERVSPLEFERRDYLLLLPPFGVDTAAVYRAWDDAAGPRRAQRAGRGRRGGGAAAGPLARRARRPGRAASPAWRGAGRPGSSRGGRPRPAPRTRRSCGWDEESGRLVRVHTVPAGWEGD